jgi:hypothetical protein
MDEYRAMSNEACLHDWTGLQETRMVAAITIQALVQRWTQLQKAQLEVPWY